MAGTARSFSWIAVLTLLGACGGGGGGGSSGANVSGAVLVPGAVPPPTPEIEGNGSFDAAQRLPRLHAGSVLAVAGRAGGDDEFDGFSLSSAQPLWVQARLEQLGGAAGALGLQVFDPVALQFARLDDVQAPKGFAFLLEGAAQLVVEGLSVEADYMLTIEARPVPLDAPVLPRVGTLQAPSVQAVRAPQTNAALLARTHRTDYVQPSLEFVAGEALLGSAPGAGLETRLAGLGMRVAQRVDRLVLAQFDVPAALNATEARRYTAAMASLLDAQVGVDYAEPNFVRRIAATTPNDTYYSLQWHYPLIQLPAAWDITTGDNNVIVAVVDTGELQHPDLISRQIPGYDFISSAANAGDGNGMDSDPTDVGDGNGLTPSSFHGTHVAGTIGADSNNNSGVAGVTWAGKIQHLRVLGLEGGSDFDIIQALLYAAQLSNASGQTAAQKVNIVNMSLGGPGSSQSFQNAITSVRNAGVTIFAAAGNNNSPNAFYPASYNGVISVSAVDLNSQKAPYSNFNNAVDIAAPGGNTSVDLNGDGYSDGVLSTLADDSGALSYNYVFYQGTSMACPHAAGVAALMLAVNPTLTPAQLEQIMTSTAVDLGTAGKDKIYGHGLINAYAAVLNAQGGVGSGTPVLGLSTTTVSLTVSTTSSDVTVTNIGDPAVQLTVNDPVASTNSGGNWLSATRVASASTSTDTAKIQIVADPTGLAVGNYTGQVDVTSNGGNQTIAVALTVSNPANNPNVDIYVLLVRLSDFNTIDQDIVNPTLDLDYALGKVNPNDYLLVAGSDDDNDGFIGGDLDQYFGAWPTLNEIDVLVLKDGTNKKNTDFSVEDFFNQPPGPLSAGLRRKFALRAP